MSEEIRDVTTITFSGPRFDDAGLELDVLAELLAYRRLLIETAKELWRSENRERQRLPKGFEDSIRLKFYSIEQGSAVVRIKRVIAHDDSLFVQPARVDEIDEAAQLIDDTIAAISEDRSIPDRMPKSMLPLLASLGENLREGEVIRTRAVRSARAAEFTCETRTRVERLLDLVYEDRIDVVERRPSPSDEEYDDSAPPLWQSVIDLGESLPAEEWSRVPTDLAANLDHYLYGSSGEEE